MNVLARVVERMVLVMICAPFGQWPRHRPYKHGSSRRGKRFKEIAAFLKKILGSEKENGPETEPFFWT
jgi:hypothetical protein